MKDFIFASNSNFGEVILKEILREKVVPSYLLTFPDKKAKRGQKIQTLSIKETARKNKIPILEIDHKRSLQKIVEEKKIPVITAGFGIIIPQKTFHTVNFFNIHPSLLPKYRGATPIQSAIINGEKKSGVSIFQIEEKVDSGPLIVQEEVFFNEKKTYLQAEEILAKKGAKILLKAFPLFFQEKIPSVKQNEEEATYTKKLRKEDGKINWNESAKEIERKVRAYNPWPGTYSKMGNQIFKILEAEIQKQTTDGPFGVPGKVYLGTNYTIAVQTKKDFVLIKRLQIEGKKSTTAKDFLQGNMSSMGVVLS